MAASQLKQMVERSYHVHTEREQVERFVKFAREFRSDFYSLDMRHFLSLPLPEIHKFVCRQYTLEEGEQLIRPKYYYALAQAGFKSGDCDDGTIFIASLLMAAGVPYDQIKIIEVKQNASDENYCHIFCAWNSIYMDNLPDSIFNVNPYAKNRIRETTAADYL